MKQRCNDEVNFKGEDWWQEYFGEEITLPSNLDIAIPLNNNETMESVFDFDSTYDFGFVPEATSTVSKVHSIPPNKSKIKKQQKTKPTGTPKKFNLHFDVVHYGPKLEVTNKTIPKEQIQYNSGTWSLDEHERFLAGYKALGRRWKQIAIHFVKTRNPVQVTSYSQKYLREKSPNTN